MTTAERIKQLEALIGQTHKHGVKLVAEIRAAQKAYPRTWKVSTAGKRALLKGLEVLNRRRRGELEALKHEHKPTPKPKPKPPPPPSNRHVTMYDAVEVKAIPNNPEAVAGYVDGFVTYPIVVARFPHAKHISIAKTANFNADILDIENGDAVPTDAPGWIRRQHARGKKVPGVYMSESIMWEVIGICERNGIQRHEFKVWSANWTGTPHIDPGANATQYRGEVGRLPNVYDVSLCEASFFD